MENKRLYGRICCLQRYMSRENGVLFAEYGITPVQMDVLVFVKLRNKMGKNVCQKDVENHLRLRASSVSTMVTALEKKEFLKRTVSEGDARTKYITLTDKGLLICKKNKILIDKCDELVQSALTEQEQETFNKLLIKIIERIDKQEKEAK